MFTVETQSYPTDAIFLVCTYMASDESSFCCVIQYTVMQPLTLSIR